ncbi:N-terminal domain of NEFA-interacting nuclear protein NIP30-domain-containing protein [Aspergillus avenaceus]|uniref:N-terminal domain of NEFA-interacting nuclear protein NIP30-domain-containing protein n=1 Tax=Aspergillus avenaceus TaxID=36643 RepID=A0A5N6U230_ASPAV|nr:N-terminal domain of NEFA-interacting nuclear protein NIP30-domain-containing protein [Aspergillus avenaceus]
MSSGFVSAGTDQQPVERDDEWLRVQQELEEERKRKADLGKQDGGKSLYEVLQHNKMAKQEAFEEKIKLKNQFRALDEDEVDFLDSIMESTRAQEAVVKKETAEGLELFRRQREEAEKVALEEGSADVAPAAEGEDWKIPARKRRRDKNKDLLVPGKKRKSTSEAQMTGQGVKSPSDKDKGAAAAPVQNTAVGKSQASTSTDSGNPSSADDKAAGSEKPKETPATKPSSLSLGLSGYSSDSE